MSQSAQIQYIVHSLHPGTQYAIAIQNDIETISFLSNVNSSIEYQWSTMPSAHTPSVVEHFHQPQFLFKWLSIEAEQTLEKHKLPFPNADGYNKHVYNVFASKDHTKYFIFVKYMDNNITTSSEYYPYLKYLKNDWLRFEYNDRYYDVHNFSCPQKLHNPKLFSWTGANDFCHKYGDGTLPEFVDRNREKEFISLLHRLGSHIFPLDAVYIGLYFVSKKVCGKKYFQSPLPGLVGSRLNIWGSIPDIFRKKSNRKVEKGDYDVHPSSLFSHQRAANIRVSTKFILVKKGTRSLCFKLVVLCCFKLLEVCCVFPTVQEYVLLK